MAEDGMSGGGERGQGGPRPITIDRYRLFLFPNRIREVRRQRGFPKLLQLSAELPDIPYIRLSKLERGEVVARGKELSAIAAVLGVPPAALLVDIDAPGFDMARWAEPFFDEADLDPAEEVFAIKLAAAMKARRAGDKALTVAVLDRDYGIPPVILSRIENAFKPLSRWNAATVAAICRVLGVDDEAALRRRIEARYQAGELDPWLSGIAEPAVRIEKSRMRIAALAAELAPTGPGAPPAPVPRALGLAPPPERAAVRLLRVHGAPRADGLIDPVPAAELSVEAPRAAGPRAFALRVCRPSLGPGLPAHGVMIVDPDVYPLTGGLAVLREPEGWRLLAIGFDRNGQMRGFSLNPDLDVPLADRDPADLAAVLSVVFP